MAEIVKCDICGVVPELRVSRSSRMISHKCKDYHSGWGNRTKVVLDWNNSNSQKIEESASSTSPNPSSPELPDIEEALVRIGMPDSAGRDLTPAYNAAVNMYDFIAGKTGR